MADVHFMLSANRPSIFKAFRKLALLPLLNTEIGNEEAWQLGLKEGFRQGLLFGVKLGLEATPPPSFNMKDRPIEVV